MHRTFILCTLVVILFEFIDSKAWGDVLINFDAIPEGAVTDAYYFSESPLMFKNSTAFSGNFVFDYNTFDASRPRTSGGIFLTANGYAPGAGYSLVGDFGFEIESFVPTFDLSFRTISFDVVFVDYSGLPFEISIAGYDSLGTLVGLESRTISSDFSSSATELEVTAAFNEDVRLSKIRTNPNGFLAYDNFRLSAVPEPSSMVILCFLMVPGVCCCQLNRRFVAAKIA